MLKAFLQKNEASFFLDQSNLFYKFQTCRTSLRKKAFARSASKYQEVPDFTILLLAIDWMKLNFLYFELSKIRCNLKFECNKLRDASSKTEITLTRNLIPAPVTYEKHFILCFGSVTSKLRIMSVHGIYYWYFITLLLILYLLLIWCALFHLWHYAVVANYTTNIVFKLFFSINYFQLMFILRGSDAELANTLCNCPVSISIHTILVSSNPASIDNGTFLYH